MLADRTILVILVLASWCVVISGQEEGDGGGGQQQPQQRRPSPVGGRVRTLQHACKADAMEKCRSSNVHTRATTECLEDHRDSLTVVCREWHGARIKCWEDIQESSTCDECARTCPKHSNALHCIRKLGTDRAREIVSQECKLSPFFLSLVRYLDRPKLGREHKERMEAQRELEHDKKLMR